MPAGSISIIVPTYNVASYLPEFLDSLTRQKHPLDDIELIFVDDGSSDDSAAIIGNWSRRVAPHTRILRKTNGGLASARNAGLDVATGRWVTFCDPDDRLSRNYLAEVSRFLTGPDATDVSLVATHLMILDEDTGKVSDTHPLHAKFGSGRRVVDLNQDPQIIHLQAASAFYRRETLDRLGLRFDDAVRPNFEDGFLTTLYLASFDRPKIGLLPAAHYEYRHRSDGSSLVQGSWARPEKYTVLPRVGYLRLLETIHRRYGRVPAWAQNVVLYDLFFYFGKDLLVHTPTAALPADVTDEFHRTLDQIAAYLDDDIVDTYRVASSTREMREAIVVGAKKSRPRPVSAAVTKRDPARRLVRVSYYFAGAPPREQVRVDGVEIRPAHAKIRSVVLLNKLMMYERIVWLPANADIELRVDGERVEVMSSPDEDARRRTTGNPRTIAARVGGLVGAARKYVRIALDNPGLPWIRVQDVVYPRIARRHTVRSRYRDAWLLLDRDSLAQDNAEHLYRYLRESHPDVNAWFVLSRSSGDWDRLARDRFRLIDYGSREYFLALLNCVQLVSSQVDRYVVEPFHLRKLGRPKWRFTFLQHGVTKDDLSRWINDKPIDLFLTVTPDEQESIVGDNTEYTMTTLESVMTGFPRHDRLLRIAQQQSALETRALLVMPTWRRALLGESTSGGNDRELRADFWTSEYALAWRSFLESEQLRELCDRAGWQLTFVPHPNMQGYVDSSPLPNHIAVHRFRDIDVQSVLASGVALVTDYSSLAFEMAYIKRPVVYYQFDSGSFFSGVHAYRKGSWSYERNGFGPVTQTAGAAIDAVATLAEAGGAPDPEYAARMDKAFPLRDGRCSERAYEAIVRLRRPMPRAEVSRPVSDGPQR